MKLDHLVLLVGSLEASLPYYDALLPLIGFRKTRDHVWGNEDGVYIDMKQAGEPDPGYRRYGVGLNHLGFTAASRDAVDQVADKMRLGGFPVPEAQLIEGAYCLFMKDPDGMRFEISCYS